MQGKFIMGLALGAVAGMVLIENSSEAKRLFRKSKSAITDMAENMQSTTTTSSIQN